MTQDISIVILAAGNSTRMKSQVTKVLHPVGGIAMIEHVVQTAQSLKPKNITLVLGHQKDKIKAQLSSYKGLHFAHQKERKGTGHALQVGLKSIQSPAKKTLVLSGDVPLLSLATLKKLLNTFKKDKQKSVITLLSAKLKDPYGYGRILREGKKMTAIIEEKNATSIQKQILEINAGVYLFDHAWLFSNLKKIKANPIKKEYYLTDLVCIASSQNQTITSVLLKDEREILGANTRTELATLNQIFYQKKNYELLSSGVNIQSPSTTFIESSVKIGADSYLESGVQLKGTTQIGKEVYIETGSILNNCRVQDKVHIRAYSYLENCEVSSQAIIGPFARIRPGSTIQQGARIGNFVELKNTQIGKGSKANHLTYLGDCVVKENANIGAGTITCNYDGKQKYQTLIESNAFIGSDTQLIAPVKIGKGAYVAAGTTVTQNVPPKKLAISRVKQKNIDKKMK